MPEAEIRKEALQMAISYCTKCTDIETLMQVAEMFAAFLSRPGRGLSAAGE